MPEFFSAALQTSLTMEGILFAAFGFLYAAFCHYSSVPNRSSPLRAPIANKLMKACRLICVAVIMNALLSLFVIVRTILFTSISDFFLGLGFLLTIVLVAYVSWSLAASM